MDRHTCTGIPDLRVNTALKRDSSQAIPVKFGGGGVGDGGGHRGGHVRMEDRGDDVVGADLVGGDQETTSASACAAAISMVSWMLWLCASSSPRNTPGKASTLLIWFG
jgi:hypothetical protein